MMDCSRLHRGAVSSWWLGPYRYDVTGGLLRIACSGVVTCWLPGMCCSDSGAGSLSSGGGSACVCVGVAVGEEL